MRGLDDEALRALAGVVPGPRLTRLALLDVRFTSEGIGVLAKVPFRTARDLALRPRLGLELDLDALRQAEGLRTDF